MTDFLDKLNLLLRSSLKSLTSSERPASAPKLSPDKLGKDVDREISALRKQIDSAISQQEALQGRIDDMQRQISEYDRQVDAALQAGDDQRAHYLLTQKQRLEQRLQTQADNLERHRAATSELIEQVNQLEAMVAEAKARPPAGEAPSTSSGVNVAAGTSAPSVSRSIPVRVDRASETLDPLPETLTERPAIKHPEIARPEPPTSSTEPANTAAQEVKRAEQRMATAEQSVTTAEQRVTALSDVLRTVRERFEETIAPLTKPREETPPTASKPSTPPATPPANKPTTEAEDDLAKRRKRLSLPD